MLIIFGIIGLAALVITFKSTDLATLGASAILNAIIGGSAVALMGTPLGFVWIFIGILYIIRMVIVDPA